MLYVTTRNACDAVTTNHVLTNVRGMEGGLYLPMRFPKISAEEWKRIGKLSFNQRMAQLLNLFFSQRLTSWDIDFSVGRYPVRLEGLPHRIFMAETWHNPQWLYRRLEKNLAELLGVESVIPGSWPAIAIRMAVLAAVLAENEELGTGTKDIAVVSGDFTVPVSAWYLRKMGAPIGNIVCCCNENNQLWDLICQGQMRTDSSGINTIIPEADVTLPVDLERLIFECGGQKETERYLECTRTGKTYMVSDSLLKDLRSGLYVSVVSSSRVETAIPNVFKSHRYLMTPASALAYSGLLDYRAKTGITRTAVVLCDKSPICAAELLAKLMDCSEAEIKELI